MALFGKPMQSGCEAKLSIPYQCPNQSYIYIKPLGIMQELHRSIHHLTSAGLAKSSIICLNLLSELVIDDNNALAECSINITCLLFWFMTLASDCWLHYHHLVSWARQRMKPAVHFEFCRLLAPYQVSRARGSGWFAYPMRQSRYVFAMVH